jgi:3-hydroxybutyryl-CoA dehydrogenase
MKIVLLGMPFQQAEFLPAGVQAGTEILMYQDPGSVPRSQVDACIDLQFDHTAERLEALLTLHAGVVAVNEVISTLQDFPRTVVRFNGWDSLYQRPVIEVAGHSQDMEIAEHLFKAINKKPAWVPDVPGLITARVIASIINEAYFAFEEGVSTKEQIDTAMKMGTNYPYGPFEWSKKIGLGNIAKLLTTLSSTEDRYTPARTLIKEAFEN